MHLSLSHDNIPRFVVPIKQQQKDINKRQSAHNLKQPAFGFRLPVIALIMITAISNGNTHKNVHTHTYTDTLELELELSEISKFAKIQKKIVFDSFFSCCYLSSVPLFN